MTTRREVKTLSDRLGMSLETGAPGDGKRRFYFTWGMKGQYSRTCYGAREAWVFLVGYEAGRNDCQRCGFLGKQS